MLRFVRFAIESEEELDDEMQHAILQHSGLLKRASVGEIEAELRAILVSKRPDLLRMAYKLQLTSTFLPEFDKMMETIQNNPHHIYTVGEHTLHALLHISDNPILRYTVLFHDIGKPATKTTDEEGIDHFYEHYSVGRDLAGEITKRLGLDDVEIAIIKKLIEWHDYRWESPGKVTKEHIKKIMDMIGAEFVLPLLRVQRADILAQSEYMQQEKLAILQEVEELYKEICAER